MQRVNSSQESSSTTPYFIEWVEFSSSLYGTSHHALQTALKSGTISVLDVNTQGVKAIKRTVIPAKFVFVSPPSLEELESRLRRRQTETEESVQSRLATAASEMEYARKSNSHDLIVVNDDLDTAYNILERWVKSNWGKYCGLAEQMI